MTSLRDRCLPVGSLRDWCLSVGSLRDKRVFVCPFTIAARGSDSLSKDGVESVGFVVVLLVVFLLAQRHDQVRVSLEERGRKRVEKRNDNTETWPGKGQPGLARM